MPRSRVVKWLVLSLVVVGCLIALFAWFSRNKVNRYDMTGTVVTVHSEAHMVTVHNDDIPGFMHPMDMDYDLNDQAALSKLKAGDAIHATLWSNNHDVWRLDNVVVIPKQ
jgi:Cu/Ag efflux protein CusF